MKTINAIHLKYVDDLTLAEKINLKTQVEVSPLGQRPQPDNFRDRTGHKLVNGQSLVLKQLEETRQYPDRNNMKLNLSKTKLMVFNSCTAKDFLSQFEIDDLAIQLVEETKLLGLVVTSDLSWSANTDYIVGRCNSKMWMIRRLQKLGASQEDLLDVYNKQIRSILEFAVPVWNSSLTGEHVSQLERIQKTALHVILGDGYKSYSQALKKSGLVKLSDRRRKICVNFALKSMKHQKFSKWFKPTGKQPNTRQDQSTFCHVYRKHDRFKKSPISYLTELLNKELHKPK